MTIFPSSSSLLATLTISVWAFSTSESRTGPITFVVRDADLRVVFEITERAKAGE